MNKSTSQLRYFDGRTLKSLNPWDVDDTTGWLTSGDTADSSPENYNKLVPTLFRAVQLRAQAAASIPFAIVDSKGEEVDTSGDWQNKVKFMPSPRRLIQLAEASLTLAGKAYEWRTVNGLNKTLDVRHLNPNTITYSVNQATGKIAWKRDIGQGPKDVPDPRSIVYVWYPDPYIELGAAQAYPAQAALAACGVLHNVDAFVSSFFSRGAIKATLFAAKDMPKAEAEKFEAWWMRFISGVKNAFTTKIMNADSVNPVVVGEGLESLQNTELTREQQEDVAVALGIPMSILFSNAANYATAVQDWRAFYETTVIPEAELIADAWNEQIFKPLGLRFRFIPDGLDCFQADEQERAQALTAYINAGFPLVMACDLLGIELDEKQRAELEAMKQEKQERAGRLTEQLSGGDDDDEPEESPEPIREEMQKWYRKAVRSLEKGKGARVEFLTDKVSPEMQAEINACLDKAVTPEDVKTVFSVFLASTKPVVTSDAAAVLEGIRLGVEALRERGE